MSWLKEVFCKHTWKKVYESDWYPVRSVARYLTVDVYYDNERKDRKWKCSKCGKIEWDAAHTKRPPNPYY